jgi:hypothetical protein
MTDAAIDPAEMHWFDVSNAFTNTQRVNLDPIMSYRPPFEKCMVVWQGATKSHQSYEVLMMIAGNDPEEGIVVSLWKGPGGTILQSFPAMVYLIEDDNIRYGGLDDDRPLDKEIAEVMLAQIGAWYAAMDKRTEVYVPVIKNTFTNKRKIAAGKFPAYEWKTVYIEPIKPRLENRGGTHASPRLHDRRGHLRRLKSGKNVWVKAHKVGEINKGIVFHDYAVAAA